MNRLSEEEYIKAKQDFDFFKRDLYLSANRQEQLLDELMTEREAMKRYKVKVEELKKIILYEDTYREVENNATK